MKLTTDILPRAPWNSCEEIFRIKNTRFILLKTLKFLMAFAIRTEKTTKRMRCQILKVGFSRCEKALWNWILSIILPGTEESKQCNTMAISTFTIFQITNYPRIIYIKHKLTWQKKLTWENLLDRTYLREKNSCVPVRARHRAKHGNTLQINFYNSVNLF